MKSFNLVYTTIKSIEFDDKKFDENANGEQELMELFDKLTKKYPNDIAVGRFIDKAIQLVISNATTPTIQPVNYSRLMSWEFDAGVCELIEVHNELLPDLAEFTSSKYRLRCNEIQKSATEEEEKLAFEVFRRSLAQWSTDNYYKQFVKLYGYLYDKKDSIVAMSLKRVVEKDAEKGNPYMINLLDAAKYTTTLKAS